MTENATYCEKHVSSRKCIFCSDPFVMLEDPFPRGRPRRLPYPLVGGDSEAVWRGALGRALGRWNRGGRRPGGLSGPDGLAGRFGQMAPGEGFFIPFLCIFFF